MYHLAINKSRLSLVLSCHFCSSSECWGIAIERTCGSVPCCLMSMSWFLRVLFSAVNVAIVCWSLAWFARNTATFFFSLSSFLSRSPFLTFNQSWEFSLRLSSFVSFLTSLSSSSLLCMSLVFKHSLSSSVNLIV